jgi:ketosteroid isomerase-like protein
MRSLVLTIMAAFMLLLPATASAKELTTADIIEIEQLYAKYNHALDSGDADAWAGCYVADGVFTTNVQGSFAGAEKLKGFAKSWTASDGGARRHLVSNLIITGSGAGADGKVYLELLNLRAKPTAVAATGIYTDTLVKTKDGWRFKTRTLQVDTPATLPPAPAPAAQN